MYFPQIQPSSLLSILFLNFSLSLKKKKAKTWFINKIHTPRNIPPEKKWSLRPPKVHCSKIQCKIYAVCQSKLHAVVFL